MIFIEKMKSFKIYKTKTFLPTIKGDKKKGSAVLLMTPNYESSKKLMNNPMFVNSRRFASYYIERDVSYYINSKVVEEVDENTIFENQTELDLCLEAKRSELPDEEFGVSSKRKFPLDAEKHVRSAIKFFNYVDPEDEEELAEKIIKKIKEMDIKNIHITERNRFSKYYPEALKESVEVLEEDKIVYPNCTKCGVNTNVKVFLHGEPIFKCTECGKVLGVVPYNESAEELIPDVDTEHFLNNLCTEDVMNIGDTILFFNEASVNDTQMKRLLYTSRIRKRKDLLVLLDKVKADNKWIQYAYPDINKYLRRNLFVDLYYYNSVFFERNTWINKKGLSLYTDLVTRLINHPVIKNAGYSRKTIFIPVSDWDKYRDGSVWNFRRNINPISCIYQMMFENKLDMLKKAFGNIDIIFIGGDKYFKLNFSEIDPKEIKKYYAKFKLFCIKICKNEEFEADDVDYSADNKEEPDIIAAKLVDKIETSKGVDITKQVSTAVSDISKEKKIDPNKPVETDFIKNTITAKNKSELTKQNAITKKTVKASKEEEEELEDNNGSSNNDEEKAEKLKKLADAIARASEDSDSEEDALDELDRDDIKRILVDLGSDDEVNISASRSSRMTKLNDQLMDKEVNGRTVSDILSDESNKEPNLISVEVSSPNKEEWKDLSFVNFDKNYNIDKDIVNIFKFFSECTRPISIVDIKAEDNSTSEDRLSLYTVNMEDYRGKRYTIKLDIPIMEDNRFLLRGNNKSIQTQFFNMPIIKTELDTCQLISNYKKIFLYRFGDTNGKSLPAVSKLIKAAKKYTGRKLKFIPGNNTKVCSRYKLPIDYIDLSGIFSRIESDSWIIYFNQDEIRSLYTIEENKGIPFAYNKKINAVEYISSQDRSTFINIICDAIFAECLEFKDLFASMTRPSICAYSRASIMSSKIPVVIICGYHIGLRSTMDRAGIEYKIVSKLDRETKSDVNYDWVQFNDGYVVYKVDYESSLLMNGLKDCSTEIYNIEEIDNKNMYLEFLDNYGGRIKADGLDNFYDLFVDPMIKESLEYYKLPTNYIDILLYGSSLLNDNKYIKHTDTSSRKLRRYQLVSVYAYQVLSTAYGSYATQLKHSRQAAEFNVKQSAVIDMFLADTITSDDSCINALRDVETTNAITTKGPSGMNADRAYSIDKRAYDDSMVNVLGMSTGFAGNVGVTRQSTINSNVTPDGYVKQKNENDEMNDSNTLTATEALIPFGSTRDDPMRTAMSFIQTSKHSVRTEESDPLLVTSGADEVMPYLTTDKFAFKAKDNGVIKDITNEYIIVEYQNGKCDYINLKETIEKNSDGGYFVPLKLDADEKLKVGVKIQKNQILAYDKYSFSNSVGESNNIAYNVGKIAKVAIINSDEGFEDSGIISESMANKLATRVDLQYTSIVNKDSTIFKIAKVGEHIEASDDLLIWQDAFDDTDAEEVMAGLIGDGEDVSDIGKRKLKSEVTGVLKDIKIFRTVDIEELSPSIKKIVNAYEKPIKDKAKILKDNGISISKLPAHYPLAPNGKLKKAQDAIIIEFYVEYLDTVGVGDKIVYNAANKAVEKGIFPIGREPYTEFRPNEKIDAFVSVTSISKRLVSSTLIYGGLQKLMVELDRSVKDIMGVDYDDTTI